MALHLSPVSHAKLTHNHHVHTAASSTSLVPLLHRQVRLRDLTATCSHEADSSAGEGYRKDLAGTARDMMESDPATRDRLQRVRDAAAVVASLQAQKEAFNQEITAANYASAWEAQDQERRQAQRASERGAQADLLNAADDLEQAQAEVVAALQERSKWSAAVNEGAEKLESAKAGIVAAAGGVLGSLPYLLSSSRDQPLLLFGSLAAIGASGLLFGVTYRYALRQDLGNQQLKGGVVGAFGLVRGLALAEAALRDSPAGPLSADALGLAAVLAGESMLTIGFAAAAIELAFRKGLVKPFGTS